MTVETGTVTGTKDKNYNLIWYTEKCLDKCLATGDLHPGRRAVTMRAGTA
jgi:hypothetical protein